MEFNATINRISPFLYYNLCTLYSCVYNSIMTLKPIIYLALIVGYKLEVFSFFFRS
ncbi:hypothetical protein CLU79DRAFT_726702 [Phycomyces nitens]|nr:hypothetical protein CLU79DRAFT_726702 [Phycomyces nitens]